MAALKQIEGMLDAAIERLKETTAEIERLRALVLPADQQRQDDGDHRNDQSKPSDAD